MGSVGSIVDPGTRLHNPPSAKRRDVHILAHPSATRCQRMHALRLLHGLQYVQMLNRASVVMPTLKSTTFFNQELQFWLVRKNTYVRRENNDVYIVSEPSQKLQVQYAKCSPNIFFLYFYVSIRKLGSQRSGKPGIIKRENQIEIQAKIRFF